ncbi:hypothetical protein BS47DRAFT_1429667 [Hydnum rufescens UP504]|uniref:Uncharacterized protein n=1 Tax=Hydnum rufescens UP504 TaxID=1448309 RepID=A0A9P6DQ18_9AGAM|nr:hypothetical protein BS47DRAFT_1429667 [Hydnum rufescens UP504]
MFSLSSLFAVFSLFILAVFQIAVALPVVPLPFSRMAHDLEGRSLATDNYVRAAAATLPDGVITIQLRPRTRTATSSHLAADEKRNVRCRTLVVVCWITLSQLIITHHVLVGAVGWLAISGSSSRRPRLLMPSVELGTLAVPGTVGFWAEIEAVDKTEQAGAGKTKTAEAAKSKKTTSHMKNYLKWEHEKG